MIEGLDRLEDDLADMTNQQLQELRTELKTALRSIQTQLENWISDELPKHMLTTEWRRRAANSLQWHVSRINLVRGEITRRRLETEESRPRETPEQKSARIAATEAASIIESRAFVRAAYRYLSPDEFRGIWALARELFPECFSPDSRQGISDA